MYKAKSTLFQDHKPTKVWDQGHVRLQQEVYPNGQIEII